MAAGPAEAHQNPLRLIEGLLAPMRRLVGDSAGSTLFRYAAVQEGRRLAGRRPRAELNKVLDRLDEMLGQRTEVLSATPRCVRLYVHNSHPELGEGSALTVLLGLFEGAIGALYALPMVGELVSIEGDRLELEIVPEKEESFDV